MGKPLIPPEYWGDALEQVPLTDHDRYRAYLRSPGWREKRERWIELAEGHCERCETVPGSLDIHHITYENVFNEGDDDIEVLCRDCHFEEHRLMRREAAILTFARKKHGLYPEEAWSHWESLSQEFDRWLRWKAAHDE